MTPKRTACRLTRAPRVLAKRKDSKSIAFTVSDLEKQTPPSSLGHTTSECRLFSDPMLLFKETLQDNLTIITALFMALFAPLFLLAQTRLQPTSTLHQTLRSPISLVLLTCWFSSSWTFIVLHCMHLREAQSQHVQWHWATPRPHQRYIMRIVATLSAVSIASALQSSVPLSVQMAVMLAPSVVNVAVWINSLWDSSGNSLNMAGAMTG